MEEGGKEGKGERMGRRERMKKVVEWEGGGGWRVGRAGGWTQWRGWEEWEWEDGERERMGSGRMGRRRRVKGIGD